MLYWALVFFVIAIIAGFLGFGGIAFAAAGMAKILFFIFLVVFVVMLLTGLMGRRSPPIWQGPKKRSNQFTNCSESAQSVFREKSGDDNKWGVDMMASWRATD